jgi:hypothetical protein
VRAGLTRRHVLALAAAGGALVTAGGVGLALQGTVLREPRVPLQELDPVSFSVFAAAADRFCPATEGLPSAWDLQVPEKLDALLAAQHPGVGAELGQVLWLLENALAGLVLDRHVRPFSACDAQTQDRVLRDWQRSAVSIRRTAYKALRGLSCAPYWADPQVFAHVGYPGPPQFRIPEPR